MITVVIPSYNQKEFLSESIQSALDQTVKPEIIVVDDGSTDGSYELAKSFPVKVIRQKNKGLPGARNRGIKAAKGEYILPLDADDILLENCVEVVEKAIKETKADVITPQYKMFGVTNGVVSLSGIPSVEDMMRQNCLPYFSSFKKSIWQEVGGYNPNMKFGWEDWDFWLNVFKRNHSLCILPDVLVLYRTKEHSMLHDAYAHAEELSQIMMSNHPELWQKSQ